MSVGVIGLGYVGLPLTMAFAEAGEQVVAVDLDPRKIAAIADGESYIEDIPSDLHGSADYRKQVGAAMVTRAWADAMTEATNA